MVQAYNKVCSRVRNCMDSYVGSGEGGVEKLAIKFLGASAERPRVLLKLYQVSFCVDDAFLRLFARRRLVQGRYGTLGYNGPATFLVLRWEAPPSFANKEPSLWV